MEKVYISVDIGGSYIRVAAYDKDGNEKGRSRKETPKLYAKGIDELKECIRETAQGMEIAAVGLGVPGVHNRDHARIAVSSHLPKWQDEPIEDDIREEFDCPVTMDNDVTVAALAEAEFGFGRESDFLFMIWGTGYGSALVERREGLIITTAFEAGHQIIQLRGRQCGCGQKGCLEAYIGGGHLADYLGQTPDKLQTEDWLIVAKLAALGLINTIMIRPTIRLVVYSGGTIQKRPDVIDFIKILVRDNMTVYDPPKIVLSKLGEDSGLLGGLVLAKQAGGD